MKYINFCFILVSIPLFGIYSQSLGGYKHKTTLDHDNNVRLEWNITEKDNQKYALFKLIVIVPNSSPLKYGFFVGFGMSDRGDYKNADLLILDVSNKDSKKFSLESTDAHTDSSGVLKKDKTSNYNKVRLNQESKDDRQIFIFEFTRKLDTCDPDDYRIESGTVHLIHFIIYKSDINAKDLMGLFEMKFKPINIEMKQTQLVKSTFFETRINDFDLVKAKRFDVVNNKVKLPDQDTTYWCMVYKLDKRFSKKHHIIAFEGLITKINQGIVHHMELFHCITDPSDDKKNYNGPCKSEEKPAGLEQCRKVIAAWAMGASRFVYPDHVGGVIGGPGYSPYLVLEIHYDNPNLRHDIIDSSGLRIYYQGGSDEELREYDAGIMEIGLEYNSKNSIPPKSTGFHLHGHCLSECTQEGVGDGITIFASQLHTHLTGRRVWTSLIRDGKVVSIINRDNHYDQMFQEIRLLHKPINLKPGDAIINTCIYDTTSRVNMTFGGYSIRDEMCVNYMHYYPAVKLEVCKSSISDEILDNFFKKMKQYDFSNTSETYSDEKNFNLIRWTPLTSSILSKLYDISPISFSCNSSEGKHLPNVYETSNNNKERKYFPPIQAINLKDDYAPIDPDLIGKCNNAPSNIYFDNDDEEDDDDNDA